MDSASKKRSLSPASESPSNAKKVVRSQPDQEDSGGLEVGFSCYLLLSIELHRALPLRRMLWNHFRKMPFGGKCRCTRNALTPRNISQKNWRASWIRMWTLLLSSINDGSRFVVVIDERMIWSAPLDSSMMTLRFYFKACPIEMKKVWMKVGFLCSLSTLGIAPL